MIEDVELTRKILGLYAEEDRWPSAIGGPEIRQAFPDESNDRLIAHVVWAADAGMFKGTAYHSTAFTHGTQYDIGYPDGLSKDGSDYIKYARSGLWKRAKSIFQDKSVPLTTQVLAKILPKLAEDALTNVSQS